MASSASPNREARPLRPPSVRRLGTATAVLLLLGVAATYQVGVRSRRPPSFEVGGTFADPADFPPAGTEGRPYPYGDASTATPVAPEVLLPALPPEPVTTAPPGTITPSSTSTPTKAAAATKGPATPPTTRQPAGPIRPAAGTYTYAVKGSEGATGAGSRSFPPAASVAVHHDPTVGPDELVHDIRLSGQHEEREVIRYGEQGLAFSFEAGSITFGSATQASQATYKPPMVQIPWPLRAGLTVTGASDAVAGSGQVTRTETWAARVVGQEVLTVLGQPHATWIVDVQRTTKPGSAEQVHRVRRYWYDPALGVWVRWTERFHGERNLLITFSYDADYRADLTGFTPTP